MPVPVVEFSDERLANGLRLIVAEDHLAPVVAVHIWYNVGSKHEVPGKTGFAHLFEHVMFQGSANVGKSEHMALIQGAGGTLNGTTWLDRTNYFETLPSHQLELGLWLEADRMATLRVEKETFEREREVVKEERRMRVENQPYGRLSEIIYDQAFTVSPYKHPTIGSMADLEAASIDDVREFYRTYYVPGNATLVLAGDFEPARAMELVTKYLGRVPKSDRPIPRDYPKEPPQTRERHVTLREPWPLPVVVVAHPITYDGDPDSYPLHIASKILSDGQSSRIYRKLVYETGIALTAFVGGNILEEPNLFFAVAVVQPGHTPEEAEKALAAELDRLKSEPVSEHELERAKNQFARDYIIGRESSQEKAGQLAHAVAIHKGDITTADGEFDIFMNTTAADVQRVARTYFKPENRTVLTILPRAAAQK